MNCVSGVVKRVDPPTNMRLGDTSSSRRRASGDLAAAGTSISKCVRRTEDYGGKDCGDKSDRSGGPTLAQLIASCREEIARLVGILRESRCCVVIRGVDGSVLPVA